MGFPGGSDSKESACNVRDWVWSLGLEDPPGEGNGYLTPIFLPGEFHGQKSLAGYNPGGRREWDMTQVT